MRKIVAVIGDAKIEENSLKYELAYNTGRMLVDNGYRVLCGGMGGIMEACLKGAKSSMKYVDGDTIAISPSFDNMCANQYADIVIPTGLDLFRNIIVANSCAVVAIGGGAGTLTEMASAWTLKRLIIAYSNVEGWSRELAGRKIDHRIRYDKIPNDCVYSVESPEQVNQILNDLIDFYNIRHTGIIL